MATSDEQPSADPGIPCPDGAFLHDIIIVGAGPCGLAVAARLREQNPAALFTDEEHRRFHWMKRHGKKMALQRDRKERVSSAAGASNARSEYNMVVLDAEHDTWMGRWNHLFKTFDIKHLRSPMFWHVDPNDRDSLLSKAYGQGREKELLEIKNCVGKEVSKHKKKKMRTKYVGSKGESRIPINERDRNDYFNPTQSLFRDHCDDVVGRYGLHASALVRKERVLDITYAPVPGISTAGEKIFTVRTNHGVRYSPIVVVAVGPGNKPCIPEIPGLNPSPVDGPPPQVSHAMQLQTFPSAPVRKKIAAGRRTNILIVGGGLTSAQLADLAVRHGVTTVWHTTRAPLRSKLFDVDLSWMGKFRNTEQARFWQAEGGDAERLALLRSARGGGSVTPAYGRLLRAHAASGRVRLLEGVKIVGGRFEVRGGGKGQGVVVGGVGEGDENGEAKGEVKGEMKGEGTGVWYVETDSAAVEGEGGLPPMDHIYFATGVESDFAKLPFLQTMLESHPIEGHGGFPCLNDDLMWEDGVPLFVAGRLAALKLGPSAPNLGGARLAAERIAWGIEEVVRKGYGLLYGGQGGMYSPEEDEELAGYATGTGNMFRSLVEASA
ncbi:uncharacterized protein B0H64DRAFT_474488 [Chaetomium fimeti]|uniref:L-ornithine N(5)-oxygenase n=1 Tax=Chaetomium fimeti TaxID=1854472 RepID=A0AAE0LSD8_9PEZI|nr:hypothetical protein B0H64DRAFT_474488 [Chaetomium fimeti]